jgi:hypothetical protein
MGQVQYEIIYNNCCSAVEGGVLTNDGKRSSTCDDIRDGGLDILCSYMVPWFHTITACS